MGKRKSAGIPCHSRKRARQPSILPPCVEAVTHMSAEDHVYCAVCKKTEGGPDFILCDACDGGMHRQCAKLDQIPEGFWACITCEQRPTVESAIRQVLHEHIESGLSEEDLLMKVRERVPLGISGPAEMSTGLEQALKQLDPTEFAREYQVVRLKGKYHLVTTAAADARSNRHLVPDSEDEHSSMQSSATLDSEEDAPRPHGRRRTSLSSSSRHSCPVAPTAAKRHQHNGNSAKDSHRLQNSHSYQQCGDDGANLQVRIDPKQQQSICTEPQDFSIQTSWGSTAQQQAQQQQQHQQQQQQQQQDSSLDFTNHKGIAQLCACSALAGLARFHAYSAATEIGLIAAYAQYVQMQGQHDVECPDIKAGVSKGAGPAPLECKTEDMLVDTETADQQLSPQAVAAPSANFDQELNQPQARSPENQILAVPVQLPSAEDSAKGVARFLSIMSENDATPMSVRQQRNQLFRAASQLVGLSRHTESFEHHLDTLSSSHAAGVVQIVSGRIMAASKIYPPEMAGVFIQQYWQSLAA